jgi:DNA (cytosine-5)-methyltransferase 1
MYVNALPAMTPWRRGSLPSDVQQGRRNRETMSHNSEFKQFGVLGMKVVDLFAGVGGLSLGFELAGFSTGYALEQDKWAVETFAANRPDVRIDSCDIRSVRDGDICKRVGFAPAVVIGGPPCQGFSHSNTTSRDPRDPRNTLFQDYIRFVAALRPAACLVENVKGLCTATNESGRRVLDIIMESLSDVGYEAQSFLLDAADYGVPQHRDRLFIVGFRRDIKPRNCLPPKTHDKASSANLSLFDRATVPHVTLWNAISDLPQIVHDSTTSVLEYEFNASNRYQELMRVDAKDILNHEPMRHTARLVERFARIKYGESEADVPDGYSPRKRGMPEQTSEKRYGQNSRRQHPDYPCNTVPASSHTNFLHPYLHRNFTVRELARIQSFPDRFVFKGKRAVLSRSLSLRKGLDGDAFLDQRAQVGNAVPPILAKAIAEVIAGTIASTQARCA